MIIDFKLRKTKNIRSDNDVLNFDYVKKLSKDFPAMSLEKKYQDREHGYTDILLKLIDSCHLDMKNYYLGYYSEFVPLQDNSKILKYKGYWFVKDSQNEKYANLWGKRYSFLTNKKEFLLEKQDKLKMSGIVFLNLENTNEIEELIKSVSYNVDRGFFFIIQKNFLDEFEEIIKKYDYSDYIDFVVNKHGCVFILLGDEDNKSSEIVVISNEIIINRIIHNIENF